MRPVMKISSCVRGRGGTPDATTAPRRNDLTLDPNSVYRRFHDLPARADVPAIRFRDLQHASATLLLAEGVHGKIGQERLGHASIAMTLDLYSYVTADLQRQAVDASDAAIAGAHHRTA
jgi:integrase